MNPHLKFFFIRIRTPPSDISRKCVTTSSTRLTRWVSDTSMWYSGLHAYSLFLIVPPRVWPTVVTSSHMQLCGRLCMRVPQQVRLKNKSKVYWSLFSPLTLSIHPSACRILFIFFIMQTVQEWRYYQTSNFVTIRSESFPWTSTSTVGNIDKIRHYRYGNKFLYIFLTLITIAQSQIEAKRLWCAETFNIRDFSYNIDSNTEFRDICN